MGVLSCKRPLSIYSSLMVILLTVIGYFGVSDADVVLRGETESENGLVLNKLQPSQSEEEEERRQRRREEEEQHPFRHFTINNDKSILGRNSKDAENESLTIDESMWDQIVIRALANPTEWVQLRQALDKVDTDLRALTALENSKRNQSSSKSVPKWKFTYHRVMSPQITNPNQTKRAGGASSAAGGIPPPKTKAFAAVSLAALPQFAQQQQPVSFSSSSSSSSPSSSSSSSNSLNTIVKDVKGSNLNIMKSEDSLMGKGKPKLTGTSFVLSPFLPRHDDSSSNINQNHLNHNGNEGERRTEEKDRNEVVEGNNKKWMTTTIKNNSNIIMTMTNNNGGGAVDWRNSGMPNHHHHRESEQKEQSSISSFKSSTLNINGNGGTSRESSWTKSRERGARGSRSRTQLEEEIAKMSSSSRANDGSMSTSFHWRPWIHHRSYDNKNNNVNNKNSQSGSPTTSSPQPLPSTTPPPLLPSSPQLNLPLPSSNDNDHHKNTWSEDLEKYHAQYHHQHHHHSHNQPHNNNNNLLHYHHHTDPVATPPIDHDDDNRAAKFLDSDDRDQDDEENEGENAIPLSFDEDEVEDRSQEYGHHHEQQQQRHHQRHNHPHFSPLSSFYSPIASSSSSSSSSLSSSLSSSIGTGNNEDDQLFSTARRISSLEYRI